ncbi:MAG: TfoX/Sxy family protein [Gammaproteobacteria bacterium]|nr:TfoX/Sxy family protein [Gammaproteobacteria bacterium]
MKISDMKNMQPEYTEMLARTGIHTKDDLEQKGAVDTYLLLNKQGQIADLKMLYALESALLDISVSQLGNDIKQHLQSAIKAPKL